MSDRPTIIEQTKFKALDLPHPDNTLEEDVLNLRRALTRADMLLYQLEQGLGTKSDAAAMATALTAINTAIGGLGGNNQALRDRADALEGRAAQLEGRSTAVEGQAAALAGRANTLEGRAAAAESAITTKVDKAIILAPDAHLNNVVTSGFYRLAGGGTGGLPHPGAQYGQLVVSAGADTIVQIVTAHDDVRPWVRSGYGIGTANPTFMQWRRLLADGDHGLGGACVEMPAGSAMSDLPAINGWWMCSAWSDRPADGWQLVQQIVHVGSWVNQISYPVNGVDRAFRRAKRDGALTAWRRQQEWRDLHTNSQPDGATLEAFVRYSVYVTGPTTRYLPTAPAIGDQLVFLSPWGAHGAGLFTVARSNPAHTINGADAITFDVNAPMLTMEYVWENMWVIG